MTFSIPSRFFVLMALATATASSVAQDEPTCALRVARLLADGQSEAVSALFLAEPAQRATELKQLLAQLGGLSDLQQVSQPRFSSHQRFSVGQSTSAYAGAWVNANSTHLGPVQLHLAQVPSGRCELQAVYLDFAP